jgi:hypothetical protein
MSDARGAAVSAKPVPPSPPETTVVIEDWVIGA